jgi:hypothetical protein
MKEQETPLAIAERHVREAEARIAHQRAILDELTRHGHAQAAVLAQSVLDTMLETLRLAEEHLAFERATAGRRNRSA